MVEYDFLKGLFSIQISGKVPHLEGNLVVVKKI